MAQNEQERQSNRQNKKDAARGSKRRGKPRYMRRDMPRSVAEASQAKMMCTQSNLGNNKKSLILSNSREEERGNCQALRNCLPTVDRGQGLCGHV